jgi:hypothetical protein
MKKPIISSKKKVAKARIAEVKKIPSRGLAPTDKSVARKNAATQASKIKPKGISAKPMTELPDSHFGALPVSMSGEGMGQYTRHMQVHGNQIQKGVDKINMKKRMSPIERDIKKQAIMKAYQSGSAKSTKSAPAKPMTKAKSKSMPVKKTMAKSTKK